VDRLRFVVVVTAVCPCVATLYSWGLQRHPVWEILVPRPTTVLECLS